MASGNIENLKKNVAPPTLPDEDYDYVSPDDFSAGSYHGDDEDDEEEDVPPESSSSSESEP